MTTIETLKRLMRGYDSDFGGRIDLVESNALAEAIKGLQELDDLRAVMIAKDAEIAALPADLEAVGAGGVKGVLMPGPAVDLSHLDPERACPECQSDDVYPFPTLTTGKGGSPVQALGFECRKCGAFGLDPVYEKAEELVNAWRERWGSKLTFPLLGNPHD